MSDRIGAQASRWINGPLPADLMADLADILKDEDYAPEKRAHRIVWQALKWMMANPVPKAAVISDFTKLEAVESRSILGQHEGTLPNDLMDLLNKRMSTGALYVDLVVRIEELEAKHQETFQMYVDANEARIDAEEKLQDQTHLIGQLFVMLDKIEQTDDGRIFHPNQLRSCRVADTEKLNEILAELKGGNDDRRRTDPHVSE